MHEMGVHFLGWEDSPKGGNGNPLQDSCLENSHGERSPAGYSPWGHKESDMTEPLNHNDHDVFNTDEYSHDLRITPGTVLNTM